MTILGKVASILNEREVIINKGSEDGVVEEMTFRVTTEGIPVTDPDTGESLGIFIRDKIGVKISEIQPKFSVARTYETYDVIVPAYSSSLLGLKKNSRPLLREVTRVRTLRKAGSSLLESKPFKPMTEDDSLVLVGDRVIQDELLDNPPPTQEARHAQPHT
jgi:hypothetical protein